MSFKNIRRKAYINEEGLRVNCDGTTIKDRKPDLKLKSNHFKFQQKFKISKG